jgi:3'(2'), 5'-bisphosphate nucleotidase
MSIILPESLQVCDNTIEQVLMMLVEAGKIALKYHNSSNLRVEYKEDQSPVTNADVEISDFIIDKLKIISSKLPVISEEETLQHLVGHSFWLLDPIDGTRKYINGQSNYTINLALVYKYLPVLGFIYHPSINEIYYNNLNNTTFCYNVLTNKNILCQPIQHSTKNLTEEIKVLISNEQYNFYKIENEKLFTKVYADNIRNNVSMLLNGQIDVYYLYRCSMEWDTAAVHAMLRTLGGDIIDATGNPLVYGKPMFCNSNIIFCNQHALLKKRIILKNN